MEAAGKKMISPAVKTKSWSELEGRQYPSPSVLHEDVVKDPAVFWDTLRSFHFVMGTKFMIPVIGGKELDLHILYQEVTKRGGYEKVVAEKKWREVGIVFRFSPTTTSASFVLKKHYLSLLYHYEQVYYFRTQGPLSTPAMQCASGTSACGSELAIVEHSAQGKRDTCYSHKEATSCFEAIGTIEGKVDCGYLVSVKLGQETLKGVLYHPAEQDSFTTPEYSNAIVPYTGKSSEPRRRRRRNRRHTDPDRPKPNRSGYNFFFAEEHCKLKSLYPNREREFTKIIGEAWSKLSPDKRMVYQNIGMKDKERYKRELTEYKEKMKLRQGMEVNQADS